MADIAIHTLSNGIRLVHAMTASPVAHCAVMIDAGSRDERPGKSGIAHLTEHLLFKGTEKRKAFHILSRLEDVGGELNAYTTKEETCLHASFLKTYYERTLELFGDILFHSTFLPRALKTEKEVIFEEIKSYKDSPSEQIFDDFDARIFSGHPLGNNILGTKGTLKKLTEKDIRGFMEEFYQPEKIVLASVGDISFPKLVRIAEKYFGEFPGSRHVGQRAPFTGCQPFRKVQPGRTHQAHCLLGNLAYSMNDPRRFGLFLLTNLLAGPGMNSRLNMALREKNGLVYTVEASFQPYADTGVFSVYFGADKMNVEKSLQIIHKELRHLCEKKLGSMQLHKARQQLSGQLAIAADSGEHRMLSMAKSLLGYGKVVSFEETYQHIHAVTATELVDIARETFSPETLSCLIYK